MERYKINLPHVVSEIFADEEAAIINLKTGNYYSLNKTGAEVWSRIEQGDSFSEIIKFIASNFDVDESSGKLEIEQFINRLIEEDLIIVDDAPNLTAAPGNEQNGSNYSTGSSRNYTPPVIECYADMQELLLLDPIHEVEETNWLVQ